MTTHEQTYLVFRADDAPFQNEPPLFHYVCWSAVRATGEQDAMQQVAQASKRPGNYVAIPATAMSLNMADRRLVPIERSLEEEF